MKFIFNTIQLPLYIYTLHMTNKVFFFYECCVQNNIQLQHFLRIVELQYQIALIYSWIIVSLCNKMRIEEEIVTLNITERNIQQQQQQMA